MMKRSVRKGLRVIAGLACMVCVMALGVMFAQGRVHDQTYDELEEAFDREVSQGSDASDGKNDVEDAEEEDADPYEGHATLPPTVLGWLSVGNTSISYPVVQSTESMPHDWYLDHDAWNRWNPLGCPYLDDRAIAGGQHMVIYAHHNEGTNQMFSELARMYHQAAFETLGDMTWETAEGTVTYKPLCAMRVDSSYSTIQKFSFDDNDAFRDFLYVVGSTSDSRTNNWWDEKEQATQACTLVTCSNAEAGQQERTLVVFIR